MNHCLFSGSWIGGVFILGFFNFLSCVFQWNHKQCFSDLLTQNILQHIDIHSLFGSQNVMITQKINQVQPFVLLVIAIEELFLTDYMGTYINYWFISFYNFESSHVFKSKVSDAD